MRDLPTITVMDEALLKTGRPVIDADGRFFLAPIGSIASIKLDGLVKLFPTDKLLALKERVDAELTHRTFIAESANRPGREL